jgi:hypothetical protein
VAIVELDRFAPEKNAAVRALLAGAGLVAGPWGFPRDEHGCHAAARHY